MSTTTTKNTAATKSGSANLFWRYWVASTSSNVGDAVTTVALPLVAVGMLDASSFEVSLLTTARYLAWILISLPAGVIVQRLPLRGTQVAMDAIRAVAVLSVPVAAAFDVLSLPQLVLVALVIGFASVIFDVGNSSFLPSIVSKEELTARNSLTTGSAAATQLGGPSLGGILAQTIGAATSLLVDFVSYVISAILLQSLPRPQRDTTNTKTVSALSLIREGWNYVVRHKLIRTVAIAATLINFVCGGLMAIAPVFLVRTLDAPASLVGILIATEGIGSLIGAAFTTRLVKRLGGARAILYAGLALASAALLIPFATKGFGLLFFAVGNMGFAAGVVVLSITGRTHRQTVTPPELLPRVMATVRFISWGVIPLGALTGGIVATTLGNREALTLTCLCATLVPLAVWSSDLRNLRDLY
ncbi:MFS transporter [Streptomyces sp. NPDC093510]|uniref:MFS transporter n=1 Tax=Streptomyces sp. NPDC093510 TaxID=3155199 RepID=UPI003428A34B